MNSYQKFKLILTAVFMLGTLLILWNLSENGRYKIVGRLVLDTRSGKVMPYKSMLVRKPPKKVMSKLELEEAAESKWEDL